MTPAHRALSLIRGAMKGKDRLTVAIDGRCAAGKTTLAKELAAALDCPVIHMDHFFLRPEQRTPERLSEAGGNLDRERFAREVLIPLSKGKDFTYRPLICQTMSLGDPITVKASPVTLIEGSYSCHPDLRGAYDLLLFLSVDSSTQRSRLLAREGAHKLTAFEEKWIPMEEKYFRECGVREVCVLLNG